MAHFFKPTGGETGYVGKHPNGLSFVHVPLTSFRAVALFGGNAGGSPLWVNLNDFDSAQCPAVCTEKAPAGGNRVFHFLARGIGSSLLEARLGGRGGQVWDSVQIVIGKEPMVRRGPRLGNNGTIPVRYQGSLKIAMDKAWALNRNPNFVAAFRDTVSKLGGKAVSEDAYAEALNRMVIHLAETTSDVRVKQGISDEGMDIRARALSGSAPAMSFRNEPNIWIRTFAFAKGVAQLTSCIVHEAAHVAGAPGDPVAEWALDVIHRAAGLPR